MAETHAHGLTEEALDALLDLFVKAVEALTNCESATASCLPEARHLPLQFADLYSGQSGQIAAILAANGKAVDVVGTWINMRNRVLGDLRDQRAGHPGTLAQTMHRIAEPVSAGFASVLSHPLPRGTHQELDVMRGTLGKALEGLGRP